jgi:hypothetical protein
MVNSLAERASSLSSPVEKRLFAEYGAIFATIATPPPVIIFNDSGQVEAFQSSLSVSRGVFGNHEIQLQSVALDALATAATDLAERGGSLTARADDAGARSYEDTVRLWTRNVARGLDHWEGLGRISREHAQAIVSSSHIDQVSTILSLEDADQLFFGTFFDRSILYSVAAPGASQHLSMLAFDVTEYEDPETDEVLGARGWFRTVPNDLPHFTYLGGDQSSLFGRGLRPIERINGGRVYVFWTPDVDRLLDTAL